MHKDFQYKDKRVPALSRMPSARKLRLLLVGVLAILITVLFFTSQLRSANPRDSHAIQDFYHKTVNAMDGRRGGQVVMDAKGQAVGTKAKDTDKDGDVDEDDQELAKGMAERLRAAEQKAKDLANAKAPLKPDPPKKVVGVGSSAGGQEKIMLDEEGNTQKVEETEEEHEIEMTMNGIMKKSPVIIFSKTHCPFSKKAKGVLLDKYSIDPAPYVVELDEHPMGKQIQDKLAETTGRSTVPNIIINGKSIGGGDDIAELDARKTLIDKIKSVGGQRVAMKERFVDGGKKKE